jgi:hypothetical protein
MALPRRYTWEDLGNQQAVDQHAIATGITQQTNSSYVDFSEDEYWRSIIYSQGFPAVLKNNTNFLNNSFTTPSIPQFINLPFENHSPSLTSTPNGVTVVDIWSNSQLTRNGPPYATSIDFNTEGSTGCQLNFLGSSQHISPQDYSQSYGTISPGAVFRNHGISLNYQSNFVPPSGGFEDCDQLDPLLLLPDHTTTVFPLNENNGCQLETQEKIPNSNTNSRKRGAPSGNSTSAVTSVSKRRKDTPSCGWCSLHKSRVRYLTTLFTLIHSFCSMTHATDV